MDVGKHIGVQRRRIVVEQRVVADWLGCRKGLEHGDLSWDWKPELDPHDPARNKERGRMDIRRLAAIRIHPGREES